MTGKPGVLQSMRSQRAGHALATQQQQPDYRTAFFWTNFYKGLNCAAVLLRKLAFLCPLSWMQLHLPFLVDFFQCFYFYLNGYKINSRV